MERWDSCDKRRPPLITAALMKTGSAGSRLSQFVHRICGLTYADDRLIVGVVEKVRVFTFEVLGETQDLKAVAITDGPELQLVSVAVPLALPIAVPLDPAPPMIN